MNKFQAVSDLVGLTGGKIFSVDFIKSNGDRRRMRARTGVRSYLKGGERAYNPADYGLITVFDMNKKAYRSIPAERVIRIKVNGTEINF